MVILFYLLSLLPSSLRDTEIYHNHTEILDIYYTGCPCPSSDILWSEE